MNYGEIKIPRQKGRKERAFRSWFDYLLTVAVRRFDYENLPSSLPQWEIEKRLILNGYCCIFKTAEYGVVTADGGLSGISIYNTPNNFNFAQAVLGSRSNMQDLIDGVIVYGCSIDKVSNGTIGRRLIYYADILSDIDVSKQIALITARSSRGVAAKNDNALRELKDYYDKLYQGEVIIPKIISGALDSTEDIFKGSGRELVLTIGDYDVAIQNTLQRFLTEFGITSSTEKRERLLTDEIAAAETGLQYNIKDWLKCRQDGFAQVNFLFGTDIKVLQGDDVIDFIGFPDQ